MKITKFLLTAAAILTLTGCGSTPEEQVLKAQANYTEEKTKTMQQYKKCIADAKGDEKKMDACERIMKATDPEYGGSSSAKPAPATPSVPESAPESAPE